MLISRAQVSVGDLTIDGQNDDDDDHSVAAAAAIACIHFLSAPLPVSEHLAVSSQVRFSSGLLLVDLWRTSERARF